jgi:DnaJ family protein C protein 9
LKRVYIDTDGSLGEIMNHIPHSTVEDEPRLIRLIASLIKSGDLTSTRTWEKSVKDETARLKRKKKSAKEAEEAEALAKEIGVWDEFYGSGKPTDRATNKQKGKQKAGTDEGEDVSALQALILKRKKNMDGFFDSLAAKYAEPESSARSGGSRGKKRKADVDEDPPTKKSKTAPPPPDIDDDEFAKIQESLLKKKAPAPPKPRSTSRGEAKRRAKR